MNNKIAVLDFDGTLTLVKEEAKSFLINFKKDIAKLLNKADIEKEWQKAEKEILQNPDQYGWEYGGKIIAPANADPYILSTVTAQLLLNQAGELMEKNERDGLLQEIFRRNYSKSDLVFKKEAKGVLEALIQKMPVFIVTNSDPSIVAHKIEQLNPRNKEQLQLFGDAQKYSIDPDFDMVPETLTLNGLKREIFLRRKKYFDALNQIWNATNVKPRQTLVMGDIFESDLTLPAVLGCDIFLVSGLHTPAYEKEAVKTLFRGHISDSIEDIFKVID